MFKFCGVFTLLLNWLNVWPDFTQKKQAPVLINPLPSSKLTWQWKIPILNRKIHLQMVDFPLLCWFTGV